MAGLGHRQQQRAGGWRRGRQAGEQAGHEAARLAHADFGLGVVIMLQFGQQVARGLGHGKGRCKIDPAQLNQNVAAWAALVWLIADSDVDFRALRAAATR